MAAPLALQAPRSNFEPHHCYSLRWYLFKKRMHRRRLRLVSAIAVYGDQVSMCIIFPALLAIVFALSFGS